MRSPANPSEGTQTHGLPLVLTPPCGMFFFSPEPPLLTCFRLENLEVLTPLCGSRYDLEGRYGWGG